MKRTLMLFAAGLVTFATLSGCASTGSTQTPAQVLANLQKGAVAACTVVAPTLTSITQMEAGLPADQVAVIGDVYTGATAFCATASTVDITSVTAFANTSAPAAMLLVANSSLPQDKKTLIQIGIVAFQGALNAAVAAYNNAQPAVVPTTPASQPAAA